MKPRSGTDEWSRKQKSSTKIVTAQLRPHFPVDERVFMVLKYAETGNVLEALRRFQKLFPNQRTPCRQTVMDKYKKKKKIVQYGLSLNRNVGSSVCFCSVTAFETFWLFPEHYLFTVYFKIIFPPIHLLKTVMCPSHLRTLLLLSAPIVCSSSWFHLSSCTRALQNTWLCNTCNHSFV